MTAMTAGIRFRLATTTVGMLALLGTMWIAATLSTNALGASYTHSVRHIDALSVAVAEGSKLRDDEETGLRGYLLTGQKTFLAPYTAALAASPALRTQVDALIADDAVLRPLILNRRRIGQAWQSWAAGLVKDPIAYPRASPRLIAQQLQGRALFDHYRAATTAVTTALDVEQEQDYNDSVTLVAHVHMIFAIVFVGAMVTTLLLGWRTILAVTRPLAMLSRAAQAIGEGDLDRPLRVDGAREFTDLRTSMEWMRDQLALQARLAAERETTLEANKLELERSNAELKQFAYVASHDLQEPLRTISSYLQLLSRRYKGKPLDDNAEQFITFAVDGAKHMQTLIQDLLSYSKVGAPDMEFVPSDSGALMADVAAALRTIILEKGAVLEYEGLPVVLGNAGQLRRLFQNLIANALKFCKETPRIRVTAERRGEQWLLTVRDNGIGIDAAHAERIFIIFQRLNTREEYEGTGIGLALCKKIVERHGGRIWVESRSGHGAAFHFTLPAQPMRIEQAA